MKRLKFKKGERVKVKQDLHFGIKYYMQDGFNYETLSDTVRNNMGKEATIMEVHERGYKLDIDSINWYTDDMIKKFVDVKAREDKIAEKDAEAVENILNHVLKLLPEQQINHALDTGNKELFDELTKRYPKTKG
jgi:transcriptional antiterminator Rof (Rho-off)